MLTEKEKEYLNTCQQALIETDILANGCREVVDEVTTPQTRNAPPWPCSLPR